MISESEDAQSILGGEIETLRSIYVNELDVEYDDSERPCTVAITLYPSTADNVEEQYVRLSLIFTLPLEYPESTPKVVIRNPRGLSDEKINRITEDLIELSEERKGGIMLFELIEKAKDHLTAGNRPSGACAICLYGFSDEDIFTKTECYHYFHSNCIARYIQHGLHREEEEGRRSLNKQEPDYREPQVLCPMCRVPINTVGFGDDFPPPTSSADDDFAINPKLLEWQKQMSVLYKKQLAQGGIIDIEAEKNRFLLEISNVPSNPDAVISEALSKTTISEKDGRDLTADFVSHDTSSPVKDSKFVGFGQDKVHSNRNESYRQRNYRRPNDRYSNEGNTGNKWRGRGTNSRPFLGNSRSGYREQRRGGRNGAFRNNRRQGASPEFESDSMEGTERKTDPVPEGSNNMEENTENQNLDSVSCNSNKYASENGEKSTSFRESSYKAPYVGRPYRNYNDYNRGYHKPRGSDYYQKSYLGGRPDSHQPNSSYRYNDSASTSSRYRTNNSKAPRSGYRGKPRYSSNYNESSRTEDTEESEALHNESLKNSADGSSSYGNWSNPRQAHNDCDEKKHDLKPVSDDKGSPNYSKKYSEDTSDYSKGSWNNRTHYGPSYLRGNARKPQFHDDQYRNPNYRRYRSENRDDETVCVQTEVASDTLEESQVQDSKLSEYQLYGALKLSDVAVEKKSFNASKNRYTDKRNYTSYANKKNYISEKILFSNDIKAPDSVENDKHDTSPESHSTAEIQLEDTKEAKTASNAGTSRPMSCESKIAMMPPPPGFANPLKKIIYGLPSVNPPPGFHQS